MEIFEIKGLDCSKAKNRMILLKEVKKLLKTDEKPSKERLEKVCKSLQNRYGYIMRKFRQKDGKLFVSIEVERGGYSSLCCLSYYEAMCKYILFVKAYLDYKKLGVK